MTRGIRNRIIPKDAGGDINQHLRNHIHLTNCIHLKHHMHKYSPVLHDRSLMRDLIVLQRSRSLRDPSASPPSWPSSIAPDLLFKDGERDAALGRGRPSTIEYHRDGRMLSGSSPLAESAATSKSAAGLVDGVDHVKDPDVRRIRDKECSVFDNMSARNRPLREWIGPGSSKINNGKINVKGKHKKEALVETVPVHLNEILVNGEDVGSSNIHHHGRHSQHERTFDEPEPSVRGSCSGFNRVKRRKFRSLKGTQVSLGLKGSRAQNDFSVASNLSLKGFGHPVYHVRGEKGEYAEQNVSKGLRNRCGMPWNWSRIHHRGKSFLDMAGRSLSCGLSDPRLGKGCSAAQGRDVSDLPETADDSSSGSKALAEALPLLVDGCGSQGTSGDAVWAHDYSGELGIFADGMLRHDVKSELASEACSGDKRKLRGKHHGRHQSLTQKYVPKTFRDLVGQNMVSLALSNAVVKKKIGLLYVFYGPHGTGKTSCARIFARALNCLSLEHPKPCGFCGSCIGDDMGKSRNVKEVGPVTNFDFEGFVDLLDSMMVPQQPSQYRVFIFDDCDTLSADCWNALAKVIDRASRRLVFVLICSNLDVLPHIIISRCQKFFFPKLKDADITYALQWISTKECLEIDRDALKLIASRSDGSLRDAVMTLEQLSLLGKRISVSLVQELAGLISDEKLVHLLDLALCADTINTVKNLREIMETGVEPLALMSQLATVVTDILAGSYDFRRDLHRRKFFRRQALSKEDMEKLRQTLKTLSEAEKQLRVSNDKLTWLTAALLQLAPDQQYMPSCTSAYSSCNHSPLTLNNNGGFAARRSSIQHAIMCNKRQDLPKDIGMEKHAEYSVDIRQKVANGTIYRRNHVGHEMHGECSVDVHNSRKLTSSTTHRKNHVGHDTALESKCAVDADIDKLDRRQTSGKGQTEIEEIWSEVLENVQNGSVKEFMYREGQLISVSYNAAPTVQLIFSSSQAKSKAEKFKASLLQAFESVLGSPVIIELRFEPNNTAGTIDVENTAPLSLSNFKAGQSQLMSDSDCINKMGIPSSGYDGISRMVPHPGVNAGTCEIEEVAATPRDFKSNCHAKFSEPSDRRALEGAWTGEGVPSSKKYETASVSDLGRPQGQNHCQTLVRSKVSLAHVVQQAEGSTQHTAWTKRKAVSIAEKLEQENMRLEPRFRSLLCWRESKETRRKLSRLKFRTRKPRSLLKLVSCGICQSAMSPR
ncbi:hypothetical protein Dimus_032638 [Dionaea muscipula]